MSKALLWLMLGLGRDSSSHGHVCGRQVGAAAPAPAAARVCGAPLVDPHERHDLPRLGKTTSAEI